MNLIDAIATSLWVSTGIAEEFNPLMATLLGEGSSLFILTKITLVSLCVLLMWRLRSPKKVRVFIFPVFLVYIAVMIIHIVIGVDFFRAGIPIIEGGL